MNPRNGGRNNARNRTSASGKRRVGTFCARSPSPLRSACGNVFHPHELVCRDETLAGGRRRRHRADVQIREIAHVDDPEAEPRQTRRSALQQTADHAHRTAVAAHQRRAEHRAGQNRREFGRSSLAMNSHAARSAMIFDRRYASKRGSSGSAQTVSSLTAFELIGVRAAAAADVITTRLTRAFVAARSTRNVPSRAGAISESRIARRAAAERRRNVQHVVATAHRGVPAAVVGQIGDDERQSIRVAGDRRDRRAHVRLLRQSSARWCAPDSRVREVRRCTRARCIRFRRLRAPFQPCLFSVRFAALATRCIQLYT